AQRRFPPPPAQGPIHGLRPQGPESTEIRAREAEAPIEPPRQDHGLEGVAQQEQHQGDAGGELDAMLESVHFAIIIAWRQGTGPNSKSGMARACAPTPAERAHAARSFCRKPSASMPTFRISPTAWPGKATAASRRNCTTAPRPNLWATTPISAPRCRISTR